MSGLSYRARKRLALLILGVGLPVYIVVAVTLVGLIDRPGILIEVLVYVGLGLAWIVPLRAIFRGVAQPDPGDAPGSATGAEARAQKRP